MEETPIARSTAEVAGILAFQKVKQQHPEIAGCYEFYMREQQDLFARKMLDYGISNISVGTQLKTPAEVRMAMTGLFFRMNDKLSRMKQLVVLDNKANVTDEKVKDTMQDIANYALIAQIVDSGNWK